MLGHTIMISKDEPVFPDSQQPCSSNDVDISFNGSFTSNEVQISLDEFLKLLQKNNDLKDQLVALQSQENKNPWTKWIHLSKAVDSWRIIPRLLMIFYMSIVWQSIQWFTDSSNFGATGPSSEQSMLISVVAGAGAAWFGAYVATGGKGKE